MTLFASRAWLRDMIWLLLATFAGVLLCWLALQAPASLALDVGGTLITTGQQVEAPAYDLPFLRDVHAAEPALPLSTTLETYRWTYPAARLDVPQFHGAAHLLRVRLSAPPVASTALTLTLPQDQLALALAPGPRLLHLYLPASAAGDATVGFQVPAYAPPGDARLLGLSLDQITIQSLGWRLWLPWSLLGRLGLLLLLLGVGALLSGLDRLATAVGLLALGAVLALVLLLTRPLLTIFSGALLLIVAVAFAFLVISRLLAHQVIHGLSREAALVIGLAALGWALRMIGMRHPQANYSDLMLHVNNLTAVARGNLIFTENLPCEAGAGASPYPPGVYLLLLPLTLLTSNADHYPFLLQGGVALLDALVIPLLWWALRSLGAGRSAVWGASLYLLPSPLLKAMTIGEMAQVGGQAVAMPAVLGSAVWISHGAPQRWRGAVIAALTVAALVHSGVLISVGMWGACLLIATLARRRWREAGQLALVGLSALAVAFAVYYSAFWGDPRLAGSDPACPLVLPLGTKLVNLARSLLDLRGAVPPWMLIGALAGALVAQRRFPMLAPVLWAWLATGLLAQLSLLWSNQTVRWAYFIYPALCLGAGIALQQVAERRRSLAWAGCGMLLLLALGLWLVTIATYRTGTFI